MSWTLFEHALRGSFVLHEINCPHFKSKRLVAIVSKNGVFELIEIISQVSFEKIHTLH